MKIGGTDLADDLKRIEAVLEVLDGDGSRLAVDVNGRFDLQTALDYGRAIEPYGLFWYEEIGDPLDYRLNAIVSEHYSGPIATGENLFSVQDARNLIRYGGMRPDRDYIQVDPALSYGLTEYLRVQEMLQAARLVLAALHPPRRAPVLAAHRRGPQARRQRVLPGRVPAHRRLRRRRRGLRQPGRAHRDPRHRLRSQERLLQGAARTAPLTTALRCPRCSRPGGAHVTAARPPAAAQRAPPRPDTIPTAPRSTPHVHVHIHRHRRPPRRSRFGSPDPPTLVPGRPRRRPRHRRRLSCSPTSARR